MKSSKKIRFAWVSTAMGSFGATAAAFVGCSQAGADVGGTSAPLGQPNLPADCAAEAASLPGNPPQHPETCHGNPNFAADAQTILGRGDVSPLPADLKNQLGRLACRPHSTLPIQ